MRNLKKLIYATFVLSLSHFNAIAEGYDISYNTLAISVGLSEKEVKDYESIMNGPMGAFYRRGDANIFYVLGAEAETVEESLRYARLWIDAEEKYLNKVGKMLRLYKVAALDKFGEKPRIIDVAGVDRMSREEFTSKVMNDLGESAPESSPVPKRVRLHISLNGCVNCNEEVERQLARVKARSVPGLDIFVSGAATDMEIMKWAATMRVPREDVMSRVITLNHDDGSWFGPVPGLE